MERARSGQARGLAGTKGYPRGILNVEISWRSDEGCMKLVGSGRCKGFLGVAVNAADHRFQSI